MTMKKLSPLKVVLFVGLLLLHRIGYGETKSSGRTNTAESTMALSVVGSYTYDDLVAALSDYFKVAPLGDPNPQIQSRVESVFETDQISHIDANMHRFIFDTSVSRKDKLDGLFAVFQKSEGNWNRQSYILDTLGSFKPIELTDLLIKEYGKCRELECARRILGTLESAFMMASAGYTKMRPDEVRFTSYRMDRIYALAEQETRLELFPLVQTIVGSRRASELLQQRSSNQGANKTVSIQGRVLIRGLLGCADGLDKDGVAQIAQQLEAIKDPQQRQGALNEIYSAARELPLTSEAKASLKPIMEKYGPREASADDMIGYVEWLSAVASATATSKSTEIQSYRALFREKFLSGTVNTKQALLLYGSGYLDGLTPAEKTAARGILSRHAVSLPDDSPERQVSQVALENLD